MMKPQAAAEVLRKSLDPRRRDPDRRNSRATTQVTPRRAVLELTVADAAAASGLSLLDAEQGLHALVSEYRGHLKATEDGEILFLFKHGFEKPWETTGKLRAFGRSVGRTLEGAARFIVRAWVSIVLVGYVLIFVAIFLAMAFSKSEDRDSRSTLWIYALFRLVGEALFWTLHPFSPFAVHAYEPTRAFGGARSYKREPTVPFYERVDRFFFGPKDPPVDPTASYRAVLAEIRAGKGRIGLADVMRVTGLPRDDVDPMMSKLMLDYSGSVEVSEEGGIAYRFPALRKTVETSAVPRRAPPVWAKREEVPPVTGNPGSSDLLIFALNAFNLVASGWMILNGLTLERLIAVLTKVPPDQLPPMGLPIALGVVPFVFSILLFLLPLGRLVFRQRKIRKVAEENGRRAVLQAVLERAKDGGISDRELKDRYRFASGIEPDDKEITKHVLALGGDVDMDRAADGVRYRFQDLELEAKAVEAEREQASDEEAKVGKVVFSSDE